MLTFEDVSKHYFGTVALDGLSLTLGDNGIYCLLGRNGAGKTTMMTLMAGYGFPQKGRITLDGALVTALRMPREVFYGSSDMQAYNIKVKSLIEDAASVQRGFDREFAYEMAARLGLNLKTRFKSLSTGERSMLAAVLTLPNKSKVILLDEPMLGLDPIVRERMGNLIYQSYQDHPRLLVVSTHQVDEIARIAEHLVIIDQGRLLLQAGIDQIDEQAYSLTGPAGLVEPLAAGLNITGQSRAGGILSVQVFDRRVTPPDGVRLERLGLQDFFVSLVRGAEDE
jgi:ABC-2 type transport system ATP-binding protein